VLQILQKGFKLSQGLLELFMPALLLFDTSLVEIDFQTLGRVMIGLLLRWRGGVGGLVHRAVEITEI
jgi:hypothetical protein